MEMVTLVDNNDRRIAIEEKLRAHERGLLHRAFSIYVFDSRARLLIQRRAFSKYHSGGLWSNTCCSHPRPSEDLEKAASRRLMEEMGFCCSFRKLCQFTYKAPVDHLIEHEYLHIFAGSYDGEVIPNEAEVAQYSWVKLDKLTRDIEIYPDRYTIWFRISLPRVLSAMPHQ